MSLNTPAVGFEPSPLEDALGPARGRYFAAGYRGVRHHLVASETRADSNGTAVLFGEVLYPESWSTDERGAPRHPHLSSVDAIVLPMLAWQSRAAVSHSGAVLRTVRLRAGSEPWTALDKVPIQMHVCENDAGWFTLSSLVGNIRATLRFAPAERTAWDSSPTASESVYGGLYQSVECASALTRWLATTCTLESEHSARISPLASRQARGVESAYWPAITAVDYLVTMGQLTQAAIFATGGRSRATMDNLWMRSMLIDLPPQPSPLPVNYCVTTRLSKDAVLERGGQRVHDVRVESRASTGVVASATLAYSERHR